MTDDSQTRRLENLLAGANGGDEVELARKEAQELVQKLRARAGASATADRLESLLRHSGRGDVRVARGDVEAALEELRASGRA